MKQPKTKTNMNKKQDIDLILRREAVLAREKVRAITLWPVRPEGEPILPGDPQPDIEASGAVHIDIQDIIPTLDAYGMGLPPGVQMAQGVVGNEVWPVSADDVEIEEFGEVETLSDQDLGFSKITPTPQRLSLKVNISNTSIDNAAFDLVGWLRGKVRLSLQKYFARHFYAFEDWDGNKGPWSGATTTDVAPNLAAGIESEMTRLHEQGFDLATACIVMDLRTERILKQTLVTDGCGRTIIEDGMCLGYPYVVNKYFGTVKDGDGQLVRAYDDFMLGVGVFNWFAVHQHAGGRIIFDGASAAVAKKNTTTMIVNTWWSFTNLATHMATETGQTPTFRLLMTERSYLADTDDYVFKTSDGLLLTVGEIPTFK